MYAVFQLGRYIKYWQKAIIAKCVCVYLFIGLDVPIIAPSLWGQLGESQRMRPTRLLPLQLTPLISDPINTTHLLHPHQFSHPPSISIQISFIFLKPKPNGDSCFLAVVGRRREACFLTHSYNIAFAHLLSHTHTHTHVHTRAETLSTLPSQIISLLLILYWSFLRIVGNLLDNDSYLFPYPPWCSFHPYYILGFPIFQARVVSLFLSLILYWPKQAFSPFPNGTSLPCAFHRTLEPRGHLSEFGPLVYQARHWGPKGKSG